MSKSTKKQHGDESSSRPENCKNCVENCTNCKNSTKQSEGAENCR